MTSLSTPARRIFAISQVAKYDRKELTYMEMRERLSAGEIYDAMTYRNEIRGRAANAAESNYILGSTD